MTPNLAGYGSVETAMFCRIDVPNYEILRFSDYYRPVTILGEQYTALGTLLGVTEVTNDIRPASNGMTITLSGIPNTSLEEILGIKLKGSDVKVYRAFFSTTTHQLLAIAGNPVGRFQGRVDNFSLAEEYDFATQRASNSMTITCTTTIDVLNNKVAGRRTNPTDQKAFFPTDLSMDRVLSLSRANLNFGGV